MTGLNSAGSALGALHNSWSADRFSRKYTIQLGAVILIVGAGLCAGSVNVGMFMAARFIAGWGVGILISAIPMYVAVLILSSGVICYSEITVWLC